MLNKEMHIYKYRYIHTKVKGGLYRVSRFRNRFLSYRPFLGLVLRSSMALIPTETNRISTDGNPTLCTLVVAPGGLPRAISYLRNNKNPYGKETNRVLYINQSTSLGHMSGTSPTGLNQSERKRLAAAPCKRGKLHIRRHLERRKSPSPPIRRCQSRSPALCQRHKDLPDKQVGHVSFPTKTQKWCMFYYAGYIPTLAVEVLSKAAKQHSR
jgi:hypothetical protein